MKSRTTSEFRELFARLPVEVKQQAQVAYRRFQQNPKHPSLHFRQVHTKEPIYSARVGMHYRAIGLLIEGEIVWFWVGSHADYDALLAKR